MPSVSIRLGALALVVGGVLFAVYPAIRPYSDETSLQGAAAFASSAWIVAHVLAMVGLVLVTLGLLGLDAALRDTPAERLVFIAPGLLTLAHQAQEHARAALCGLRPSDPCCRRRGGPHTVRMGSGGEPAASRLSAAHSNRLRP